MALTRYGELRNQLMRESFPTVFAPVVVRDADSNYVPIPISERLVQCIWYDQRLIFGTRPDSSANCASPSRSARSSAGESGRSIRLSVAIPMKRATTMCSAGGVTQYV